MFVVVLINTAVIIIGFFASSEGLLDLIDTIDGYFVWIYVVEAIAKISGLGLYDYYVDDWNKLDFLLLSVALVQSAAVSTVRVFKVAKTSRLTRTGRTLRFSRTLKAVKKLQKNKVGLSIYFCLISRF